MTGEVVFQVQEHFPPSHGYEERPWFLDETLLPKDRKKIRRSIGRLSNPADFLNVRENVARA
jgi:hypothetical protein